MLQPADRQGHVPASRIRAPRRLLKRMRLLIVAIDRARKVRAVTANEETWCGRAQAQITALVEEGDLALPWFKDPSTRKARKRKR